MLRPTRREAFLSAKDADGRSCARERLRPDPSMNVIRRGPQPKTSTYAIQSICLHTQRHLPPQRKAFASKIHALEGICPPRSAVTWMFFNLVLHSHIQAVARQNPLLNRHLDPSNCLPRSAMTWRVLNILPHDHTKTRVQWVFSFSHTNYSSDFALIPA